MISTEAAQKFLNSQAVKVVTDDAFSTLPAAYDQLGKLISRSLYGNWAQSDAEVFGANFSKEPEFNPWKTPEGLSLAVILYGVPKAHLVADIWEITRTLPYQTGHARRPFRRRPDVNPLNRRIQLMRELFHAPHLGFRNLDVFQTARYSGYYPWQASNLSLWYTAALNDPATADKLRDLLADIIAAEDEVGIINRGIIRGLLTTNDPKNWELVEQLLLAAQREEGLRQTILESLDQTSRGALFHFLGVIRNNDLARFSAVVRAVDVWLGFGWEAPKKATINRVLQLAEGFLAESELVSAALTDKDHLVSYLALWSTAVKNVDEALDLAAGMVAGEDRLKRLLALMFIRDTGLSNQRIGNYAEDHFGEDPEVDYWLLLNVPKGFEVTDGLCDRVLHYAETLPKDGKAFTTTIFPWVTTNFTRYDGYDFLIRYGGEAVLKRLCADISKLPSRAREKLLPKVFPDSYHRRYGYGNQLNKRTQIDVGEAWKRDLIRQAVADRNGMVGGTGMYFFGALVLDSADKALIVDLLRRKGKELRKALIKIILHQDDETLREITTSLLDAQSVDQRLAGLEILTVLHEQEKLMTYVLAQQSRYRERGKFNRNETVLLARFEKSLADEISLANGFGVIDYDNITPIITPQKQFRRQESGLARVKSAALSIVKGMAGSGDFLFPELVDEQKLNLAFRDLARLLREYGKLEYELWFNEDYSRIVLLENSIGFTDPKAFAASPREKLDFLPLPEVWKAWYERAGLNDFELLFGAELLGHNRYHELTGPFEGFLKKYQPNLKKPDLPGTVREKENTYQRLAALLRFFLNAYGDKEAVFRFRVDLLEDMMGRLPNNLQQPVMIDNGRGYHRKVFWADHIGRAVPGGFGVPNYPELPKYDDALLKRIWNLQRYIWARTLVPGKTEVRAGDIVSAEAVKQLGRGNPPDALLTLYLHERGLVNDDDLLLLSLHLPALFQLLNGNYSTLRWNKIEDITVPESLMAPLRKKMLELELGRGDLTTDASSFVVQLPTVEGMEYLFRTLERMGKETFTRGYSWSFEYTKKEVFSGIVKKGLPADTTTAPAPSPDNSERFAELAKQTKVTKKRLLEVAMYAPQWAPWIAEYLGIEDLEVAVWWFHAHASDYMDGQKEKIVARFSPIQKEDFARGAIDIDWFYAAYQGVGKSVWKELHAAAKYISDGNGHRQVKTYSAVMLGEIKITETLKKIREKRDKVYVKALGLIPFSRRNPEGDALKRYKLLQQFVKESRQFGAQRQESEKLAARIGLDNLARNAGHEDTVRFTWIMEAETTRQIMNESLVGIDNVTVQLVIDEAGKPELLVAKDGKRQKTIPTKLRKHKAIVRLKEHKAYLRQQFSRTRQSLETAMLDGTTFTAADLARINQHPIVRPMLTKLVLVCPERKLHGFWQNDQLVDTEGNAHHLDTDDELYLAHPSHLYRMIEWDRYQRYAFDHEIVQPFKQIFRELYLVTSAERERKTESLRYAGHQIQPKKAAALLRTRGWTISDTDGLQRVYHQQDLVATMYAVADWYSPADVEAPMIESVAFTNRRGVTVPVNEVDPVLFSEVMRDVDLVVSVAHVGGVDPEASHSTLQMRAALVRESARLFKADNVEVKERHAIITGQHGSYNIHLGSGMVSKGGLQLNIIAVPSQHRGRLFLPFLDDDPKSAEIISKLKLLAEDHKIKDPTILGQILG